VTQNMPECGLHSLKPGLKGCWLVVMEITSGIGLTKQYRRQHEMQYPRKHEQHRSNT
jgi:hypothetical protein